MDPQLASASRLSQDSPFRGAGSIANVSGTDIDGEAWATPRSIGCDQYHVGAVTGAVNVAVFPPFSDVMVDVPIQLSALIEGPSTYSVWDFGEGITVGNQPYVSHAWGSPGDYAVVLRVYNESYLGGISATRLFTYGRNRFMFMWPLAARTRYGPSRHGLLQPRTFMRQGMPPWLAARSW